jgi:hypothetical protein
MSRHRWGGPLQISFTAVPGVALKRADGLFHVEQFEAGTVESEQEKQAAAGCRSNVKIRYLL